MAAICQRTKSDKLAGDAGWLHKLVDEISRFESRPKPATPRPKPATPSCHWAKLADTFFEHDDAAFRRSKLAAEFVVRVEILAALWIGWDGQSYSIPERDSRGKIVGISRRWPDGSKGFHAGGNRGLTFTPDWFEDDGPVYVVEGASDVAAMLQAEYCCVGRFSNSGGLNSLAELFAEWPDREIVVMGENDQKPDGDWPGRAAESLAERLMKQLQRPVSWGLPTAGKDARQQLQLEVA
jgi:phage/plasmid primase-like uncharacterized protein